MGGGLTKADLTQGAVPALWGAPPGAVAWAGWRPVLQVLDVRHVPDGASLRPSPWQCQRYRLTLSDGVYSQYAQLAPDLNHLARGDDLRPGSVIRLHSFVCCYTHGPNFVRRTIIITHLEILQTKCALFNSLSLKLYEPKELWGSLALVDQCCLNRQGVIAREPLGYSKVKQLLGAWCTLCLE